MAGFAGYGTVLTIDGDEIAELTSISGPGVSADTIDVSSHGDGTLPIGDAFREFVAGLIDGGEISMEGNLVDSTQVARILTVLIAREEVPFTVVLQTDPNLTWSGDAIVTGFETSAPHDGKIGFSASMKVTGAVGLA